MTIPSYLHTPCVLNTSPFASLLPCAFALIRIAFVFAFSADSSLTTASAMHKLHSGGYTRPIRCNSAISAASAELLADTKCQFSALLPQIRQSFQRLKEVL